MFKRKLLGRGAFTTAFQISETVAEIKTTCPAKECYAMFSQGNPLAPVIEHVDSTDTHRIYHMPVYAKILSAKKQLNPAAYKLYTELSKISCTVIDYYDFIKSLDVLDLTEEDKENVIELTNDVANGINPENFGFEISRRNIAANENGDLIMLDCFFCRKTLQKQRTGKPWN